MCSRQQRCGNAVQTLCNRLERHTATSILKKGVAWRLHSVLDGALWGRYGKAVVSSRAP